MAGCGCGGTCGAQGCASETLRRSTPGRPRRPSAPRPPDLDHVRTPRRSSTRHAAAPNRVWEAGEQPEGIFPGARREAGVLRPGPRSPEVCGAEGSRVEGTFLSARSSIAPPTSQGSSARCLLLPGTCVPIDHAGVARLAPGPQAGSRNGPHVLLPKNVLGPGPGNGVILGLPAGGAAAAGPGSILTPVAFRYRTVEFTLPAVWYTAYQSNLAAPHAAYDAANGGWAQMSYGLVSSTNDTIDALWSGIQNTPTNFEAAFDLLECYNLHLLLNFPAWMGYGGWRSDVESRVTECVGMAEFVVTLLNGGTSLGREEWERDSDDPCYLTISYRSDGSDDHRVRQPCYSDCTCCEGYKPYGDYACAGLPWDAWTLGWQSREHCFTSDGSSTGDCERPDTSSAPSSCRAGAPHHQFSVNIHASELAYQGAVCDWVMYLARMAWDYSRWLASNGAAAADVAAYAEVADQLARYALLVLAYNGRHWLHEIGHARLGKSTPTYDTDNLIWSGSHCELNCCNDVVADNWLCKVRGWLGLPFNEYESYAGDDYDPNAEVVHRETADGCSADELAVRTWSCDVIQNGVPYEQACFCSTGCYAHIETRWGSPDTEVWMLPDGTMDVVYTEADIDAVCAR
jgi:hypothetical protein